MRRLPVAVLAALAVSAGACGGGQSFMGRRSLPEPVVTVPAPLRTVPETTAYGRTSTYDDVVRFLELLRADARAGGIPLVFGTIGRTTEGREIPYVVASRPRVATAAAARATGKPIVYVQANIHAGEVEGKEALLALVRDLAFAKAPNVLDSIVLVAVPIYNADGNERFGPQSRQRTEQNGPEVIGQRPNAQGLDLNRDYVKVEAPETRASLAMFNAWDPDVFVDLHTTDGSFHGYALTYAPSLNPAAPLGDYTRTLLAELRKRVRQRHGFETFDYGNFNDAFGNEVSTDTAHSGWYTYDHRPRFGTNYYGLRDRVSVLSEAYSHDPFERRIRSTYAFVKELLSLVAESRREVMARTRATESPSLRLAESSARADAPATTAPPAVRSIALRAGLPTAAPAQPITFELLARTGDSSLTQPGVPRGIRRTGEFRTRTMPVFDRFVPTLVRPLPGYYAVPAADTAVIQRLRDHGVFMRSRTGADSRMDEFVVDSVVRAPRPFQGHHEVRVVGHWRPAASAPASGLIVVPTTQPLGRLAAYLLDPESDDSLTSWNLFDAALAAGRAHPVLRAALP